MKTMKEKELIVIVVCSFTSVLASQNIQGRAPAGKCQENDLNIMCAITGSSQITSLYYIQLQRNTSLQITKKNVSFETVVSIVKDQTPQIRWLKGSTLQSRAIATGVINTTSSANLRLTINKTRVQCSVDYTAYKCIFSGFNEVKRDAIIEETNPIYIFYSAWSLGPRLEPSPNMVFFGVAAMLFARSFTIMDSASHI